MNEDAEDMDEIYRVKCFLKSGGCIKFLKSGGCVEFKITKSALDKLVNCLTQDWNNTVVNAEGYGIKFEHVTNYETEKCV